MKKESFEIIKPMILRNITLSWLEKIKLIRKHFPKDEAYICCKNFLQKERRLRRLRYNVNLTNNIKLKDYVEEQRKKRPEVLTVKKVLKLIGL